VTAPLKARRFWAVVPAAGRGERFDTATGAAVPGAAAPGAAAPGASRLPKQYAPLAGATVLECSLRPLLREPRIERVVVVVAPDDARWRERAQGSGKLLTAIGGASRQESVLAGL